GFKKNEPVDIVIRPEDIDLVPKNKGIMNGEVKSVLFKGVHYEIIVETASGTSKTVTMHVLGNKDIVNEEAHEKISASDFYMDLEDVENLSDAMVVARANAQAWNNEDEDVSLSKIEYDVKNEIGTYPCTFSTAKGTEVTINITVVKPVYTEDKENDEAIQAFDFYKTVDEIKESIALDTDLKQWANAQAWSLEDESPIEIWDVKYDFDDEDIKEGDYQITFSTMGRELKVHTTDYQEEGAKVGVMFAPEDLHIMSKMGN
ncbi:MAG: TOBE domain-containing protein, partial [Erysipelotrichaceae bacterium]|nr:TOBE domain-containing protein [Erysipelotrichaceae bacterium]